MEQATSTPSAPHPPAPRSHSLTDPWRSAGRGKATVERRTIRGVLGHDAAGDGPGRRSSDAPGGQAYTDVLAALTQAFRESSRNCVR